MSSTLKIQSIKFTFHGGRNVRDSVESLRNEGTLNTAELDCVSTICSPAGRPVFCCLFVLCGGIPFNDVVSNSNCIQLNDVMMTVDQGCTNFPK